MYAFLEAFRVFDVTILLFFCLGFKFLLLELGGALGFCMLLLELGGALGL